MKVRLCILGMAIMGLALAQDAPVKDTKAKTDMKAPAASTTPAEMKTMTYKGTLVDMSCASHPAATASPSSDSKNSADRAAGGDCPVTASSKELGMKLDGGQTVRFDLVGNDRAQDALKNQKSWSRDLTAGKPIRATVSGVLNGDKLIVSSIH